MRTLLILIAVGALTAFSSAKQADPPFVDLTFEQASAQAERTGKAVFIDFFTTWCGPCKRLDAETWPDPSVRAWIEERTIPIKLDAEIETDLAKRYAVRGYPTLLFVDASGQEIERLIGFLPPEDFLEQAGIILDAGSTDRLIELRKEIAYDSGAPARLEFVGLLLRHEKYDEALRELVWCYDIGMGEGSVFRGSRNSRVLAEFARLADVFEPARDELDRRATELLARAARNRASDQELVDLSALNAAIGRQDRSLRLIDLITKRAPESPGLAILYRANFEPLLEAKRYEDLAHRFPPRDELLNTARRWQAAERRTSLQPDDKRAEKRRDEARREIRRLSNAYEIALGSDMPDLADALLKRVLELAPDDWYTHLVIAGAHSRAQGPSESALAHSAKAIALLGMDPDAKTVSPFTQHASLLHESGRESEALALLERTLDETAEADLREALTEAIAELDAD